MQSKYWVLTDNNNIGKEAWMNWCEEHMDQVQFFIMKLEKAGSTGKIHGQGFLAFKKRLRKCQVNDLLPEGTWNERMYEKSTPAQCVVYVRKPETAVPIDDGGWMVEFGEEPKSQSGKRTDLETIRDLVKEGKEIVQIVDQVPQALRYMKEIRRYQDLLDDEKDRQLERIVLRDWQKRLLVVLSGDPKQRRIIWLWSAHSRVGKTTTMNFIQAKRILSILPANEKIADVVFAYRRQKVIWFNFPRDQYLSTAALVALEQLSDGGLLFSNKYESQGKWVHSHIVVTANIPPPIQQLPKRFEIWELDANGELIDAETPVDCLDRCAYVDGQCAPIASLDVNGLWE